MTVCANNQAHTFALPGRNVFVTVLKRAATVRCDPELPSIGVFGFTLAAGQVRAFVVLTDREAVLGPDTVSLRCHQTT